MIIRDNHIVKKNTTEDKGRFDQGMRCMLLVLYVTVLLAFVVVTYNIFAINSNGGEYKRQVLSQQSYDSKELPYKRGTITDAKGTVLATSELVYNVIIDAYQINAGIDEETGENEYLEPTLTALEEFGCDNIDAIRQYVKDNPSSRYYIAMKNLPYKDKAAFEQRISDAADNVSNIKASLEEAQDADDAARETQLQSQLDTAQAAYNELCKIKIWFEASYIRSYPNGTLLSNVIGFANNSSGSFGLEGYYNDILSGTPGREYGYLNTDSNLERTTIPATDGYNLELTIDANVQSIIEKYLQEFNDTYADETRYGANNVGCIIMDVNTGDILGMACYPNYDLSNPYDMSRIVGMPVLAEGLDIDKQPKDQPKYDETTKKIIYMTQEDVDALEGDSEQQSRYLNALWRNFCISTYYEPGSVAKAFTLAAGLESGKMTGDETYYCGGSLQIGPWEIKCHNTEGDGILTVDEAIERSCNVALMQMAEQTGIEDFVKFQRIFGFGLKTNIDLDDEARTDSAIIQPDEMTDSDLATNSFGQNFDVTMIQMITSFASLINGGNYYEPHVVSKITDANGATVKNVEPRLLKRTVSETTSAKVREATLAVVEGANGTGHTARPAGYKIGGKTGTAETLPRANNEYVLSFMGYAPADDPQIAIYVVVNRPNNYPPDDAKYATRIVRKVLTEVLPYLGIYMTEPLTEEEEAEIAALNLENTNGKGATDDTPNAIALNYDSDGDGTMDSVDANGDGVIDTPLDTDGNGITDAVDTDGDGIANLYDTDNDGVADSDQPSTDDATRKVSDAAKAAQEADADNAKAGTRYWTSYAVDPTTGYYIDPTTGNLIDPDTGYMYGLSTVPDEDDTGDAAGDTMSAETTAAGTSTTDATAADASDTAGDAAQ